MPEAAATAIYRKPTQRPAPAQPKPKPVRRDFSRCPRCYAPTAPTRSFSGQPSQFWLECTKCNTYINTYIPQNHQAAVHKDPHRIIGNFGAYGTGKTTTSREEIFKHAFITDNANILVGANIQSQYEQTIKRELEADLPAAFVADVSVQQRYLDLINGARIMYRPFDDADKLRSYNLSMVVGVESSEFSGEVFHQAKTRLRNLAASLPLYGDDGLPVLDYDDRGVGIPRIQYDWRKIIIESNPDSGWIRTDLLNVADEVRQYGTSTEKYATPEHLKDPNISAHIASTDVNRFLPPNYIEENSRNKPKWWIARYIFGSFAYAEGLVYPSAVQNIVPTANIPPEWRRLVAHDYGLSDDAVFLCAAIDPLRGKVVVYREARTDNRNIDELAELYRETTADIPSGGLLGQPIADPKSIVKRDYNKKSLGDLYMEKGIYFKPGAVSVDARIYRLNTYIESGKLEIMDCCHGLIEELRKYKFPDRKLDPIQRTDKPVDKDNHGVNALEWIVMELPDNPKNLVLGVFNKFGRDPALPDEKAEEPWQLRDDTPLRHPDGAYGMQSMTEFF